MQGTKERIEEEAIGWVVRLRDAGPEEWEAFTAWLEADPVHAAAYEEMALADEDWGGLGRAAPSPAPARLVREAPPQRRWASRRTFLGGAIAAALVGMIGYGAIGPGDSAYAVATGAGERRTVTLADGSRIDLNGDTRLMLDRERPRFARIEQGEALFTVVHDEARPFEVAAGDDLLRDMGTVFNVERDPGLLEVGVAEGAVVFNPDAEAVAIDPGMVLRHRPGQAPELLRREPEAVTGWRDGRLIYASATVGEVAADLSRNLGVPIAAAPEVSRRAFTGVIVLEREPAGAIDQAALVLGVGAQRSGDGWILK
ncbi:FecR domain-containing protein [Sphingosinicella sp. CPCC 101087]|uniref:FecR family protein n=1 Tax=Sphingosinicella sp. CPCC 101087 TaxID=2497754 RepID=UPI001FB06D82|nr:FecR domain-containing protein [Sphingosinicella sp. CPCC 101087]